METRKIQKTGVATYTISLPKTWVIRKGLKSGDKLSIFEDKDQSLRLLLDNKDPEKIEVLLNISERNTEEEILRKFTGHYLNGATKITLNFNKPLNGNTLIKLTLDLKKFKGFEIIEQTDNKLVMQDFFTSENLSLLKTIKREYSISKLIIEETRKLLNKETKSMETIELWEDEVDKLYLLIRRQINFAIHNSNILRQFDITLKECQDFLLLVESIEKITDAFYAIAENAITLENISSKSIKKINKDYDEIIESYEMAFNSIFKKDFNLSNQAYEKIHKILSYSIPVESEKISEANKRNLYVILATLHTVINHLEEISEIGLGVF